MANKSLCLLGDSVLDNSKYVEQNEPCVFDFLQSYMPEDWMLTLAAVDGSKVGDIDDQVATLDKDVSHLVLSIGGNDAISQVKILAKPVDSVAEALDLLSDMRAYFEAEYERMLGYLIESQPKAKLALCTIYDKIPGLPKAAVTALTLFNDVILRMAFQNNLPVIDFRLICTNDHCFSQKSPIEPSSIGSRRIAQAISNLVTSYDFKKACIFT